MEEHAEHTELITINIIDVLLQEQKVRPEQVATDTKAGIQARRHAFDSGTSRLDRHAYNKLQDRDGAKLREHKGVVLGINIAITIVEELAREARQAATSTSCPHISHYGGSSSTDHQPRFFIHGAPWRRPLKEAPRGSVLTSQDLGTTRAQVVQGSRLPPAGSDG